MQLGILHLHLLQILKLRRILFSVHQLYLTYFIYFLKCYIDLKFIFSSVGLSELIKLLFVILCMGEKVK